MNPKPAHLAFSFVCIVLMLSGCVNGQLTPKGAIAVNAVLALAVQGAAQYNNQGVDTQQLASDGLYAAAAIISASVDARLTRQQLAEALKQSAGKQYPAVGQNIAKAVGSEPATPELAKVLETAAEQAAK